MSINHVHAPMVISFALFVAFFLRAIPWLFTLDWNGSSYRKRRTKSRPCMPCSLKGQGTPRHFLLGKGTYMRNCKFLQEHFKGTKAMTRRHEGNCPQCLHEISALQVIALVPFEMCQLKFAFLSQAIYQWIFFFLEEGSAFSLTDWQGVPSVFVIGEVLCPRCGGPCMHLMAWKVGQRLFFPQFFCLLFQQVS